MKKAQKKEVLIDAKESYTCKKVRAPKNAGPLEPKLKVNSKTATKPTAKRTRSEAARQAWANHRKTITAGIVNYFARKKLEAKKT